MNLPSVKPPAHVFRVAYGYEVARLPDWKHVGDGRFDDPVLSDYRVLYTSESAFGAFSERFASFRPNEMRAIEASLEWDDEELERD